MGGSVDFLELPEGLLEERHGDPVVVQLFVVMSGEKRKGQEAEGARESVLYAQMQLAE